MIRTIWIGLTRGLLLGVLLGLSAGLVEAASIIRDAPSIRAALFEAGIYAVVVDALASAGICAVLGALVAIALRFMPWRWSARAVAAAYIAGAAAIVVILVGLFWAYKANGADRETGIPAGSVALILLLGLAVGGSLYPLSRGFAAAVLASARWVAVVGIALTLCLGLVFPGQVLVEAMQHRSVDTASQGLQNVDPAVLESNMRTDLELALDDIVARRGVNTGVQPNILLITVDALRADHIGACNNDWIQTPTLDLLARWSSVSCNTYTQQPQTNPALASLFTGTYPAAHGVRVHMVDRLSESFDTIATTLQGVGYNTGAIIPWTSLEPAFSGFHRGFHTYEAFVQNEPEALKNPATAALAGIYRRVTQQVALGSAVESVLNKRGGTEAEIDGRADITAAAAINWVANNNKSHFFLWVHYFDPHYPFTPPEPWDQLYDEGYDGKYDGGMGFIYEMRAGVFEPTPRDVDYLRHLYASEVSYADHYIGQLLGYMARQGLLQNTIVVLTADHGEELGERGESWPDGTYWLHGDDVYRIGTQVPLIIFDPRSPHGRQDLKAPLNHVDIMPTILDLVGVPTPRQAQGRSVVPLITGREDGSDRYAVTTLGDDSQTTIVAPDGFKLIVNRLNGGRELYFLPDDPDERNNLASAYPDRVAALARQLDAWAQGNRVSTASSGATERSGG
jgi:arylsulfatase A-like enzyme